MNNFISRTTIKSVIFTLFLLSSLSASSGEFETIKREPSPSEQKELETLLKTTELSPIEVKEINDLAEDTIKSLSKALSNFDYTEESVSKLSTFIDQAFQQISEDKKVGLATKWGCYLGNALIKNYQGKWVKMGDGSYGVHLNNGHYLFPIRRVYKHLYNGQEDSILALFKSVVQVDEKVKSQ